MWTTENRHRYDRDKLRYPSDLTGEEWALVEPMIPPAKRGGRRREVDVREVVNGIMYVLSTGCAWRYIPKDLPPRSTLYDYMQRWDYDGTLGLRWDVGKNPLPPLSEMPWAGGSASQSDRLHHRQPERKERRKRGACIDPKGYDAGKKISGKKRHILVDTEGLLMHAVVHPADIQDRDGGVLVLATLFGLFPFLKTLFADAGYQGPQFRGELAKRLPRLSVEIIKRSDTAKGFEVLPRRWVVERTIAWLNRCRRLAKDFENLNRNALTFIKLASIRLMLRKLCNAT
jgi:transposase